MTPPRRRAPYRDPDPPRPERRALEDDPFHRFDQRRRRLFLMTVALVGALAWAMGLREAGRLVVLTCGSAALVVGIDELLLWRRAARRRDRR